RSPCLKKLAHGPPFRVVVAVLAIASHPECGSRGLWLLAVTPDDPLARWGAGRRPHRPNQSLMGGARIAAGAISPVVRGHQSHRGGSRFPVPQRDRVGGPKPRAALLTFRAGQPPQPVESPPGRERAGTDVCFAKCRRIGVMRNAWRDLAPRDRYPQAVADE